MQLVDATFEGGSVTAPGLHGIETTGGAFVGSSNISAAVALKSSGGGLSVSKSRIETGGIGIATPSNGPTDIDNTLIHVSAGTGDEYGLLASNSVDARQLTVAEPATRSTGSLSPRPAAGRPS